MSGCGFDQGIVNQVPDRDSVAPATRSTSIHMYQVFADRQTIL
jgi:hypothetical protein